ncbi:MAG: ABC-F family ATP-binding cassette domain-containing protein [Bacteroidetes bacterium]|nr:ABC-F family ATP-binding cassette domain-containing protein [Bacteroidota bacterium]
MLPCICVSGLGYTFPDGFTLFKNISFNITGGKTGIVGANGCGKTTLLKIITKECGPGEGSVLVNGNFAVLKQDQSGYYSLTLTEVLGLDKKLAALHAITAGKGTESDFSLIGDDWDIEERLTEILRTAGLAEIPAERLFGQLSAGEATRLLLVRCLLQNPDYIILDEPTNHLDGMNRELFYDMVGGYKKGLVAVSHDRQLLRLMDTIIEITSSAAKVYGGNYDFYANQKNTERTALEQKILTAKLELKKEQKTASDSTASRNKINNRAEKNSAKSGIPKNMLNKLRGKGEKTLAHISTVHEKKINRIQDHITELMQNLPMQKKLKIDLNTEPQYKGRILITAEGINIGYDGRLLWRQDIDFILYAKERISLAGNNGTGKTTLINLLTGKLKPACGRITRNNIRISIIDQKYELIDPDLTILENLKRYAPLHMREHELRIRLGRFLFYKDDVFKRARDLSGGEKFRITMACVLAVSNEPDLIILDEPTNNLDLISIEQMQNALLEYSGAVLVISHDRDFLENIGIKTVMDLNKYR